MRATEILKTLSVNLRALRHQRALTQERVAEMTGLAYRHYQDIESGKRPGLQLVTVARLAAGLGIEPWQLLAGAGELKLKAPSPRRAKQ